MKGALELPSGIIGGNKISVFQSRTLELIREYTKCTLFSTVTVPYTTTGQNCLETTS